ncbi:hypothetical protein [Geosporobacter ferrireducens]|uniref:Uncharacterized protein n=1 Tax=Geosporobacter ferrireducens TaxID=1424294 RepID=A0A1D8GBR5_9FIRM|nr:hypothetical protein [Geosporobacter ferrireducens]AOT68348.1 hypothetical protein Gferi_01310 [Geosporobacter ferrireducens]MTI53789.1 hypothetical protein [Geosporobacter ferrireducens]
MTTTEKLAWFIITVGLVVAVAALIISPILNKADDVKDDINGIEFKTGSVPNHYNLGIDELTEKVLNDSLKAA